MKGPRSSLRKARAQASEGKCKRPAPGSTSPSGSFTHMKENAKGLRPNSPSPSGSFTHMTEKANGTPPDGPSPSGGFIHIHFGTHKYPEWMRPFCHLQGPQNKAPPWTLFFVAQKRLPRKHQKPPSCLEGFCFNEHTSDK